MAILGDTNTTSSTNPSKPVVANGGTYPKTNVDIIQAPNTNTTSSTNPSVQPSLPHFKLYILEHVTVV